MSELKRTLEWFKSAIPEPTDEHKCIQIGCHFEEVAEMMEVLVDDEHSMFIGRLGEEYKRCEGEHLSIIDFLDKKDKSELLDSLVDQIVTATGVGYMMGFDVLGALAEVNRSNFSKFENGKAVFDSGKISKGKHYTPPNLKAFIGDCDEN